ncbi:hypothetical protein [Sphingomonas faeni]|uniref:hypothetical protein n=1 Tax=Sphingomonas faeni TaxID=185950 RepID=UPI0033564B86
MADTITEVHSLASADNWYFEDYAASSAAGLRPVACFALVSSIDPQYASLGQSRSVVPIPSEQIGAALIGVEIPQSDIVHVNELKGRFG